MMIFHKRIGGRTLCASRMPAESLFKELRPSFRLSTVTYNRITIIEMLNLFS
jgi:hypothetical protein